MTLLQRDRENYEEGREKGREEGRLSVLRSLIITGALKEYILELEYTEEEYEKALAEVSQTD